MANRATSITVPSGQGNYINTGFKPTSLGAGDFTMEMWIYNYA